MKLQSITLASLLGLSTVLNAAVIKIENGGTAISGVTPSGFTAAATGTTYTTIDCAGGTVTLSSANEYVLDNITFVTNGVLEIEPGTIVRGEPRSDSSKNDPGALVITRTARIDAQGTASSPIIFTTAAVDNDSDGIADGVVTTVLDSGTDDAYMAKSADQYTPGDIFLDADPVNSPLAPTVDFANRTPGVKPVLVSESGGFMTGYIETTFENRSLWGGIIILGNAPTNIGLLVADNGDGKPGAVPSTKGDISADVLDDIFEGSIEGLKIAEVGELAVYGGLNPADSSGVMTYVSIRHGGSGIGSANEINGLTLGGVGRGTLTEYIEVYANGDDGYEWFGGTVDSKYLISLWNNDDSFDIDEGFTGRGQFWFSLQGDDTINGDHGGEHDGTDAAHDSIDIVGFGRDDKGLGLPPAYITVHNATYIGSGEHANDSTDSGANRALRIRDGFNGEYYNSIFADFKGSGSGTAQVRDDDSDNVGYFKLINCVFTDETGGAIADANALVKSGAVKANWTIEGATLDVDPYSSRRVAESNPFTGVSIDATFDRTGKYDGDAGFDPRPVPTANLGSVSPNPATYFTSAQYRGAFQSTDSHNNIWTGSHASTSNPAWSVFGLKFLDLQ